MKKLFVLGLSLSTLSVFAQERTPTEYIEPNVTETPGLGLILNDDMSNLDRSVMCVNRLESAQMVSSMQTMYMSTHIQNLRGYGVQKLMEETPNIVNYTNLLSNLGVDFDFNQSGATQETKAFIASTPEIDMVFSADEKAELNREIDSVSRLINRSMMGYGGSPYNMGYGGFNGGYPGSTSNQYPAWQGELSVYYDNNEENPSVELQYEAHLGDFRVVTASDVSADDSSDYSQFNQVQPTIEIESADLEVKVSMGGFGGAIFEVIDSNSGEQVKVTNNPYEVCNSINQRQRLEVVVAQTSEAELEEEVSTVEVEDDAASPGMTAQAQ